MKIKNLFPTKAAKLFTFQGSDNHRKGLNSSDTSDKSKHSRLIQIIYENHIIKADNVWVSTVNQ